MHWTALGEALVVAAAFIVGFSKTGVPGSGILVVPLMALAFGGRLSVGATLPMLCVGDLFAVAFYRSHAQWDQLRKLIPWVIPGLLLGTAFLQVAGKNQHVNAIVNPFIGCTVLLMLAITLLRGRLGDKLVPHSPVGIAGTGLTAGFTTMASNAAGPVMAIYMTATGMDKHKLMGTSAWYFFIFNLTKIPLLIWLTLDNPTSPMWTTETLRCDLYAVPVIALGAVLGKKLFHVIPQKAFTNVILGLSAVAALKIIFL